MRVPSPVLFLTACPMRETEYQGAHVDNRRNNSGQTEA
jgi:hypothetical protein